MYLGASGWLFLSLILHWLGVSAFRGLAFERNYESLFFFLPSIFAAGAAFILTPTVAQEGDIDLEEHYFSVAPWALRCAAAYTALGGFSNLLVPNENTTPPLASLTLTSVLLLLSFTGRPGLHRIALSVLVSVLVVGVVFGSQ